MTLRKRQEDGPWHYEFMFDNVLYRRSTKTKNKRLAQRIEERAKFEVAEGKFIGKRKQKLTIQTLWDLWESFSPEKVSLEQDRRRWRRMEEFFGKNTPINAIEREEVDAFVRWLQRQEFKGRKLGPKTVRHYARLLGAAMRLAQRYGYVAENVVAGAKLPKEPEPRNREITCDEFSRISEAISQGSYWVVQLCWYCGLRLREAFELEWKRIDLDKGLLIFKEEHTKTRSSRRVPIPDELLVKLRAVPEPLRNGIFGEGAPQTVTRAMGRCTEKLGIADARLHDFRHSYATRLRRQGVDIMTIAKLMGHTNMQTLSRYMEINEEDLVKAVRGLKT